MKYSCVSWSQSWHRKLKPEDCAAECADNELFGGAMSEVQFHVLLIHVGMQIVCPWIWLLHAIAILPCCKSLDEGHLPT